MFGKKPLNKVQGSDIIKRIIVIPKYLIRLIHYKPLRPDKAENGKQRV
jgi:hypothetical protein